MHLTVWPRNPLRNNAKNRKAKVKKSKTKIIYKHRAFIYSRLYTFQIEKEITCHNFNLYLYLASN